MFSVRFERALALAARRHDGQRRKGSKLPYLTHLVHVARMLEPYGEDTVLAGLLHDILEDTCKNQEEIDQVAEEIRVEFGSVVIGAVLSVTEPKFDASGEKTKVKARKKQYLEQLKTAPAEGALVSAADKIHNLTTLIAEFDQVGPEVWKPFSSSAEDSFRFYESVSLILKDRLQAEHPLVQELLARVDDLKVRIARI